MWIIGPKETEQGDYCMKGDWTGGLLDERRLNRWIIGSNETEQVDYRIKEDWTKGLLDQQGDYWTKGEGKRGSLY